MEIIVPAEHKKDIREQLENAGIHSASLFPDLEHLAKHIKGQYKRFFL